MELYGKGCSSRRPFIRRRAQCKDFWFQSLASTCSALRTDHPRAPRVFWREQRLDNDIAFAHSLSSLQCHTWKWEVSRDRRSHCHPDALPGDLHGRQTPNKHKEIKQKYINWPYTPPSAVSVLNWLQRFWVKLSSLVSHGAFWGHHLFFVSVLPDLGSQQNACWTKMKQRALWDFDFSIKGYVQKLTFFRRELLEPRANAHARLQNTSF